MAHNCVKRSCSCNECVHTMERSETEAQNLTAKHQELHDEVAELRQQLEQSRKVVEVLAERVSFSRIMKHEMPSDDPESIVEWAKAEAAKE